MYWKSMGGTSEHMSKTGEVNKKRQKQCRKVHPLCGPYRNRLCASYNDHPRSQLLVVGLKLLNCQYLKRPDTSTAMDKQGQ
jgi:hypothetical protein